MVEKTVLINGKSYKAKAIENLRLFLERIGFKGFGLCHSELIISSARCDLCLVKVDGRIVRSCEYFVNDDVEVIFDDLELKQVKVSNFEILVSNHRTDCERCHQNGLCNLQSFSRNHNKSFPQDINHDKDDDIEELSADYRLDHGRCINCSLCVDFSKKIFKDGFFSKVSRGKYTKISSNKFNLENVDLGKYRDLCPTGAIHHSLDKRVGGRSNWGTVDCRGCDKKCRLMARTIDHRYLDIRSVEGQLDQSCEVGRLWWQSLDFWQQNPPMMKRIKDRTSPIFIEELIDILPTSLNWSVLLSSDLYPDEQLFWQTYQSFFSIKTLSPASDSYEMEIGPFGSIDNQLFEEIALLEDNIEALILVEPFWKYKPEFIAQIRKKCKFLVLITFSQKDSLFADIQLERNTWMSNYPVLPPRQMPDLMGIIELIKQKAIS